MRAFGLLDARTKVFEEIEAQMTPALIELCIIVITYLQLEQRKNRHEIDVSWRF